MLFGTLSRFFVIKLTANISLYRDLLAWITFQWVDHHHRNL